MLMVYYNIYIMNRRYVVSVTDLAKSDAREIVIDSSDPMSAHKQVYMKTKKGEEISCILDGNGDLVFDNKKGFVKSY